MKNAAGSRETRDLFDPQANYRKDNPETSKDAAIGVEESGNAATWRLRCLQAVRDWPGMTAGEYADRLEAERAICSRRLPELLEKGYVRKGDPRPCNISHYRGATWWPVGDA